MRNTGVKVVLLSKLFPTLGSARTPVKDMVTMLVTNSDVNLLFRNCHNHHQCIDGHTTKDFETYTLDKPCVGDDLTPHSKYKKKRPNRLEIWSGFRDNSRSDSFHGSFQLFSTMLRTLKVHKLSGIVNDRKVLSLQC